MAGVDAPVPLPLRAADLSRVEAILTDFDGTLTSGDVLRAQTLAALWALREAGVRVAFVSGRPAGWAECWARTLPIDGVVAENGGLYFARRPGGRLRKIYAQREAVRREGRRDLERAVRAELRRTPGARLSSDSRYTEVDLAIDYNEESRLPVDTARAIVRRLRAEGFQAVRSSVHVNCWAGRFDKLSTSRLFCRHEWRLDPGEAGRVAYVGDSFNDAPMFGAFALAIGVANVRPLLPELDAPPKFITRAEEGRGFEEVARAVLAQRRVRRRKT